MACVKGYFDLHFLSLLFIGLCLECCHLKVFSFTSYMKMFFLLPQCGFICKCGGSVCVYVCIYKTVFYEMVY